MDTPPTQRSKTSRLRPSDASPAAETEPTAVILDNHAVVPPPVEVAPPVPVPEPAPPLPAIEDVAPPPPPPSDPVIPIPGSPFNECDVVQVIDQNNRHYGQIFTLGDVKHGKAHGYHISEGAKKEFLTVPVDALFYIGRPKVRARVSTSPKWQADHR